MILCSLLALIYFLNIFFSIWVFVQEHSRFTGQQEKGEPISLIPLYHFHPLHRHLTLYRTITAESSPLHIASSRLELETFVFRAQVAKAYIFVWIYTLLLDGHTFSPLYRISCVIIYSSAHL